MLAEMWRRLLTVLVYVTVLWHNLVVVVQCWVEEDRKPTYLTAAVGDYTIMNCDLDFPQNIPIPYLLNWNKEGKSVFSWNDGRLISTDPYVGRIHLLSEPHSMRYGRASINLTAIRESDAGWFECKVLFPNRTPSSRNNGTWFFLTVNGNLLAVPPINQTTMEGDEAEFSCVTKYRDTKVVWYKDTVPLKDIPDILQRSWVSAEGSLTIRPTAMGDSGEYQCQATHSDGEVQAAKAYLNVEYKAKVIYAPREIHLPYGRAAIVDCHFRANPQLTNLRWEKDGFLFDPYNVQGVFYRPNGSLSFSRVDESHNGYYTCTPYNRLGTEGPSPSMRVIVQRPPVFVLTPGNLYLRKLGEVLELPCDARDGENDHKPIIVWYRKDGASLPVGRYSIKDGNLTIINIQEEDRGLYQCSATNEAATISTDAELIVENVEPRAPYNLTSETTSTSIHLRWIAGRKRPGMEYNVWYKPVDTNEWRTVRVSSRNPLEATISNLNPGREYELRVLSSEKHGDGLFSKTVHIWTKGYQTEAGQIVGGAPQSSYPPLSHPLDTNVHFTDDGYLVTWDPPERGSEDLRVYIVRWFQGPREFLYGTAETKNTSYLIPHLEEGYDYNFQVIAMSYNDYQAAGDKFLLTVPPYKKIKSVSVGLITAIAILAAIAMVGWYIRWRWFRKRDDEEDEHVNSK